MVENYITLSLETHLFFSRIMKEHALFLETGFPCKDHKWIVKSEYFRQEFEKLLMAVVKISDGNINNQILESCELVTEFTMPAEKHTEHLSGVPINTNITKMQANLHPKGCKKIQEEMLHVVNSINKRALELLKGLIDFKESILREMESCRLFSFNYPLLIKHIIREARLYCSTIEKLMHNRHISYKDLWGTEEFWNQIMMEHALFIRGLLDPSEEVLIKTTNDFSQDYKKLLEMARHQDCAAMSRMSDSSLEETLKYRDFKADGAKGILCCDISSVILPLLADHVLREANHYIRILQCANMKEDA